MSPAHAAQPANAAAPEFTIPLTPALNNPLLASALEYGQRGWKVLPVHSIQDGCCSCGKSGCSREGKHPRTQRGVNDASGDPEVIAGWWEQWPHANVAIATGEMSGIAVLDVERDCLESLERLLGERRLPPTFTTNSGGGGKHFYFLAPLGVATKKVVSVGDFQGNGAYVIAPPSNHHSGGNYGFSEGSEADTPLAALPSWLFSALGLEEKPSRQRDHAQASESSTGRPIYEGSRDTELVRLGGWLRAQGCSEQAILDSLTSINQHHCRPPKSRTDIYRIAKSVSGYPPRGIGYTGGTFWERDLVSSLLEAPDHFLLYQILVSEVNWRTEEGPGFGQPEGELLTSYSALGKQLAYQQNNQWKGWPAQRVKRAAQGLEERGLILILESSQKLGTRLKVKNYRRHKGFQLPGVRTSLKLVTEKHE